MRNGKHPLAELGLRISYNGQMYIETFGTEEQIQINKLAIAFTIADEGTFDYSHFKEASQGMFSFVYLTDKGIEAMAESQNKTYIKNINDALDVYWR